MNPWHRIWTLAKNTYREAVRDKLLYNLLLFAGLMIASSILLAGLHIGDENRIYRDVGLSAIAFFGVLIAIFVGINLVYREISQRTVYSLLAKPVRRWEFIAGKYFGLLTLLALEVGLMTACFLGLLLLKGGEFDLSLLWGIVFIFGELALVTALAMFFTSFTTPYLAGMFTVALWIMGHLLGDLRAFGEKSEIEAVKAVTSALYWSLPNLDRLDFKADAGAGNPIETVRIVSASLYCVFYSAALLMSSMVLFQRRDFR